LHNTASLPQDFDLDLTEAWDLKHKFKVYFAVMASTDGVAADGTDFLGCMSVSLQSLCDRAEPVKDEYGKMMEMSMKKPRWFHLLGKLDGLFYEAGVVKRISSRSVAVPAMPASGEKTTLDMEIDGRDSFYTNSCINDLYHWQPTEFNSRPTYRGAETAMFMYYLASRGVWAVGHTVGSFLPCAYIESSGHGLPHESTSHWYIYTQERSAAASQADSSVTQQGIFQADVDVKLAAKGRDANAAKATPTTLAGRIRAMNDERQLKEQRVEWRKTLTKGDPKKGGDGPLQGGAGKQKKKKSEMADLEGSGGGETPPAIPARSIDKPAERQASEGGDEAPPAIPARSIDKPAERQASEGGAAGAVLKTKKKKTKKASPGAAPPPSPPFNEPAGKTIKVSVKVPSGEGMGVGVLNYGNRNSVAGMSPTGNCAKSGLVKPGDMFLEIGGTVVANSNREDCIAAIKAATAAGTKVALVLLRPQVIKVALKIKPGASIGIGVMNEDDSRGVPAGNCVRGCQEGGSADLTGKIKVRDWVSKINGNDVLRVSREDCVQAMKDAKAAGPTVHFEFLRG
jgi:hypothetical protein